MNNKNIIEVIKNDIIAEPYNYQNYDDLYGMCYDEPDKERDTLIWL